MKVLKSSPHEYAAHMRILHRHIPQGSVRVGTGSISIQEARKRLRERLSSFLPKGQKTPHHYFYTVYHGQTRIGYLWLQKRPDERPNDWLWINHIYILSRFRSKGYGTKVIHWIESRARRLQCTDIGVDVFIHNTRAVDFYGRCGFAPCAMRKQIE